MTEYFYRIFPQARLSVTYSGKNPLKILHVIAEEGYNSSKKASSSHSDVFTGPEQGETLDILDSEERLVENPYRIRVSHVKVTVTPMYADEHIGKKVRYAFISKCFVEV